MKIFLVSSDKNYALDIAKELAKDNDYLTIASTFTTNKENIHEYMELFDQETIGTSFRNNVLLYVTTHENISEGMTYDNFINNDIIWCNIKEFNMISNKIFNEFDSYVIWIDSKSYGKKYNHDIYEVNYFEERLENLNNEYFLDEDIEEIKKYILNIVLKNINRI